MAYMRQEAFAFGEDVPAEEEKGKESESKADSSMAIPGSIDWYAAKQREYWNAAFPHKRRR